MKSLICSVLLVLTTIHTQDFSDTEGDSALGRLTFPIYAPNISRVYTLLALITWSFTLGWLWNLGLYSQLALSALGLLVGWRFYRFRSAYDDKNTFICYTVGSVLDNCECLSYYKIALATRRASTPCTSEMGYFQVGIFIMMSPFVHSNPEKGMCG